MTSTIERAVDRLGRRPQTAAPARAADVVGSAPAAPVLPLADVVSIEPPLRAEPVEAVVARPRPSARAFSGAEPVPEPPSSSPPWWSGERPPPWGAGSADGVLPVLPLAPRAGAAASGGPAPSSRESAVQPHEDVLPAEPADTAVGAAADPQAHAVVVRGQRSVRRALDLLRMARDGLLVPGGPVHAGADEFRAIKRALLRSVIGAAQQGSRRANLVLVTSATPGEGKTWFATNLALSLAGEVDHSALLVDVAGGLSACTGLPPSLPGLLDLLAHPLRLGVPDIMVASQIPKCNLLPLGAPTPHAAELLASYAMDALLDDLARRYRDRVVILDAPSVLGAGEVLHLAGQVGQVIVVVGHDHAPAETVRRAFGALQEHPRVMAVLNRRATIGALHGRPASGGVDA